jgi:hypothetical protein
MNQRRLLSVIGILLAALLLDGCSAFKYMTGDQGVALTPEVATARTPVYRPGDWTIARGTVHNHTTYSDGQRTPEDLIELARREGMAIVAINDHAVGKIRVGNAFNLSFNGIEKVGYKDYLDHIGRLKAANPDLIILPGIEAMPYLWNMGKAPNFLIFGENNHFTVYGIDDPAVFDAMPYRKELPNLSPEPFPGYAPYQRFVDYILDHGGLIDAVHVDSKMDDWYGPAHFLMPGPVNEIHDLRGLTGFSILPEGYSELAGGAGGSWDAALVEYLVGGRDQVPWALGDADYHEVTDTLAWATTLFYLRELTEPEVYRAMREGRMVALMGTVFNDAYVAEFSVSADGAAPDPIMFGQKTTVAAAPVVRFRLNREIPGVSARLIRNGKVVHRVAACDFEFSDRETFERRLPAVYRVELTGPTVPGAHGESPHHETNSKLFTNPIFVYLK